jgi:hypothetical protein
MIFRPWQQWQLDAIRRHYPTGGPSAVAEHVPNRTLAAIARQANAMGIKRLERDRRTVPGEWDIPPDEIKRRAAMVRAGR